MKVGEINIPKIEIEPFAFVHDYQTRIYLQYASIIEKDDIGRSVVKSLSEDPRVTALNGKMISNGSSAQIFEVKTLAMWFLWCANEHGLENARKNLELFLTSDEIPVINTLWVLGVEIDAPIKLNDNYILQPLGNMPDSRDKEYFLQSRMGQVIQRTPVPMCAITKTCTVNKAWGQEPPVDNLNKNKYWEVSKRLQDIAHILNALNGVSCIPFYSTSYVDSVVPFGPFGGSGGGSPVYDVLARVTTKLSGYEIDNINGLIEKYQEMYEKGKDRIQRILNRLSQAKRRIQIEDIVLDLGIALEMLLLKDNPNNTQLSLSFRLRGSWLLSNSKEDRLVKYQQLKEIYNYRSQVAHSGILCDGNQEKIESARRSFPEYLLLAENICQKIIKDGSPDWDKLILNAI